MSVPSDDLPRVPTQVGHADWGENVFRGHATVGQLVGHADVWSLLALAVGHAPLDPESVALLDDLTVCMLAADPRIWPLKVTRLAAAHGGVVGGLCAGLLATDRAHIGPPSMANAARLYVAVAERVLGPEDRAGIAAVVEELAVPGYRFPGFGVAFRDADERVEGIIRSLEQRRRTGGYHWRLLTALATELRSRLGLLPNASGATAAVLLDLGFDPDQIEALGLAILLPNWLANAVEGAAQASPVLQRLPPGCVRYVGAPPRTSPRARSEE